MPKYTPATLNADNAIRRFSDARIEEAMRAQLSKLPKNRSGAVVMFADEKGIKGAVYGRKKGSFFGLLPPGEWSYVGTLGVDYQGRLSGGAAVAYHW